MIRPIPIAVALVIGITGAQAEDEITVSGVSLTRDVHCDGQTLRIVGADNTIEVTGHCRLVVLDVADNKVTIERADAVRVAGAKQTLVLKEPTPSLEVHGSENSVRAQLSGEGGRPAGLEVSGSANEVAVTLLSKAELSVTGADQKVTYRRAPGAPRPSTQISGIKNTVAEDRTAK